MPYDNLTSRTDAQALIPEKVVDRWLDRLQSGVSAALSLFTEIPVSTNQTRLPILSVLPIAYFVTGDTGQKQTTEVNWSNKYLNVEEIAVIQPVPQNVVDDARDSGYDVFGRSEPLIIEAIGRVLDAAVFFGTNAPAAWPTNVRASITAAANEETEAAGAAAGAFFGDIDNMLARLELDGYDPSGFLAATSAKGRFRAARSTVGEALDRDRVSPKFDELDGAPVVYPMRGLFPAGGGAGTNVRMFAIDRNEFVVGIRKDITVDFSTDAVIQDNTGAIVYNLFQQDMVAARFTFRVGWQVANTINYDQPVEASRYPAASLEF
jgi:HK97 family phage major capsid protein